MVIRPIPHTDLKTSMFYVWLRLDGVCAVAGGGPKRSSGVSCLRSDGASLVRSGHSMPVIWNVKGDVLSTFPASTWGLTFGQDGAVSV